MIARVDSFILQGIDAVLCEVEVSIERAGMSSTTLVGLPDAAVKESLERVRTAVRNTGYRYPSGRITINLAPADIRKEGPVYDLPIAVALLLADGTVGTPSGGAEGDASSPPASGASARSPGEYLFAGELALDGRVRSVRGAVSLALLAQQQRRRGVIVPRENAAEAAVVESVEVIGVSRVDEVVGVLNGSVRPRRVPVANTRRWIESAITPVDLGDIRGQEAAKRALVVAAAGGHNLLMIGPAGTGKTMMAKALPGILPPLTPDEALEVTRIYSSVGQVPRDSPLIVTRPVRTPHHTASSAAIIGGGSIPRPGDVTLAHRGVLFMDEMPEFSRSVLETLRQPLEDGWVTIARVRGSVRFPARFMLVAALNPAADGGSLTNGASSGLGPTARRTTDRYLRRLSAPLIDRIDIQVEVPAVPFGQLTGRRRGTDSADARTHVLTARAVQRQRQDAATNAVLTGPALDRFARADDESRLLLSQAMTELGLSARAYDKVRRVARTIADLDGDEGVRAHHFAEAVQYRLLDRVV